jgi:hypothetical protein
VKYMVQFYAIGKRVVSKVIWKIKNICCDSENGFLMVVDLSKVIAIVNKKIYKL